MTKTTASSAPAATRARGRQPRTYAKRRRRSLRLAFDKVYQFKIALKGIEPAIWRRIQVPADYSFWDLHVAVQDSMGWKDCHLHAFRLLNPATGEREEIGIPNQDRFVDEPEFLPGWDFAIADYFSDRNPEAEYEYDFGDGWEHEVTLEKILPRKSKASYPLCLAGERACPPEDCGGPPGYEDLLTTLVDPNHEDHQSTLAWLGRSFDPERFAPNEVHFDDPQKRWQMTVGGQ